MQVFIRQFPGKRLVILSLLICAGVSAQLGAQDLESIYNNIKGGSGRRLDVSGGLNLSNSSYYSQGIAARRDALQWLASANLNLRFMGVNAPFALYFSDGNRAFRLPSYTFTGISPTYKWATLHLGDRNMNFSRYTLNGILFRGAGLELRPGRWYAGVMYGRLSRATAEDLTAVQRLDPVYRRIGYGARVGYMGEKTGVSLSWFGASDDEGSIPTPQTASVLPMQNGVLSLQATQRLSKKMSIEGEFARSATNTNQFAENLSDSDRNAANTLLGLFKPKASVQSGNAWRAGAQYSLRTTVLNAGYERIDQGFRTLGALFFLSDVERITAGLNQSLLKNKIFLSANAGTERTDLNAAERNGVSRFIGSLNVGYNPTDRLSFNGSYSNFQNTAKLRTVNDVVNVVDSLILAQVTQSASFTTSLTRGTAKEPGVWSLSLTQQSANSILNDEVQNDSKSNFFITSLFYSKTRPEGLWNWSAGVSWNLTELAGRQMNMLSPSVGAGKSFMDDRLRTNARLSYNTIFTEDAADASAINFNLGANYSIKGGHALGLESSLINRSGQDDFLELYARVFYAYLFNQSIGGKRPRAPR